LIALGNFLGILLILGFDNAVKMTGKWLNEAHQHEMAAKENLETKIAALRYQISPHFFMNTLNNIHALVDVDPENAKESCIRLSRLMRYLLYDSETGNTTLTKEIEFIRSFFDLMRLRYDTRVQIEFEGPAPIPSLPLPSLLFLAFIENAFKHGIQPRSGSYVRVHISLEENLLKFSCVNSRFPNSTNNAVEKGSGIGLSNVRHRLDLLYPGTHQLLIQELATEYSVVLEIPLV